MNLLLVEVTANQQVMASASVLWFRSPELARAARPGQFLLVREPGAFLRHPFWFHRRDRRPPGKGLCSLLYGWDEPGGAYLRGLHAGDVLDVLGPLGRGYRVHEGSRNLLLIAEGWGTGPLVGLAEAEAARGKVVTLLAGAADAGGLYPSALLPEQAEVTVATADGSAGYRGPVADLASEHWGWADEVYAAGPPSLYRRLRDVQEGGWPRKRVQALLEGPRPCGVGACYLCSVETRRGPRLLCRDGPAFYLDALVLG